MKQVLWFSRHKMTTEQHDALEKKLGAIMVTQIDGSPVNVHTPFTAKVNEVESSCPPLKNMILLYDIIAIVAPIGLQQQILGVADDRPVIIAKNRRELVPQPDGTEAKVVFNFDGWERLVKIEIITEPFALPVVTA